MAFYKIFISPLSALSSSGSPEWSGARRTSFLPIYRGRPGSDCRGATMLGWAKGQSSGILLPIAGLSGTWRLGIRCDVRNSAALLQSPHSSSISSEQVMPCQAPFLPILVSPLPFLF